MITKKIVFIKQSAPAPKKAAAAAKVRAAKKLILKPAAKRAAAGSIRSKTHLSVPTATVGGYTVFGSPTRPLHRTKSQIAEAVASLH